MKKIILLLLFSQAIIAYGQDALPWLNNLSNPKLRADTLMSLAMKQFFSGSLDSATQLLNKGLPDAERTGSPNLITHYLLTLGNTHTLNGKPQAGLAALSKASRFTKIITDPALLMKYFIFTALAFEGLHRNDSAIHYLHLAEAHNNRTDPYKNWIIYNQIGGLFHRSQDFEQAETYFRKAYEITKSKGIRVDYGMVLYRFLNMVYDWGRTDKFAYLLEERERFVQSSKSINAVDPTHRIMFVDWSKKPFADRVQFLEKVKAEFQKREATVNVVVGNQYLAEAYEREKDYNKALFHLEENTPLMADETDVLRLYYQSYLLYRVLKKAGKNKEAVAEADRLLALRDSITRRQKAETVLELETRYQSEQKERNLVLLKAENNLNELRLARKTELTLALQRENNYKDSMVLNEQAYNQLLLNENRLKQQQLQSEKALKAATLRANNLKTLQLAREQKLRWQLVAAASLLALSGGLIFFLYRKQKQKNALIQKQSDDLQMLMKEIHHRVKNNLQVISSLLDLQSLSIKDKQAAGAVREGKIRVQSMALIHQNLYSEGNIKGIEMKDYIHKLVDNLFNSYNIEKDKVRLVADIDHLNLDVDTVIPLGLIVNELISNSLKYAFKETEQGEIFVALKKTNQQLELKVKDNGCGFPPAWNEKRTTSFGYNLITAFAQKLKAKMDVYNDGGACVCMNISRYRTA